MDADDGEPSVTVAREQVVEGVFVVIDQFLPSKDQRVVAADGRDGLPQRRSSRSGFLPAFVLLDEILCRERGDLIGPFHDAVVVLHLHAQVGIQVENQSLFFNLCISRRRHKQQQQDITD